MAGTRASQVDGPRRRSRRVRAGVTRYRRHFPPTESRALSPTLPRSAPTASDAFDVLIVGAGLSGIGAAYYLQSQHPDRRYAILDARDDLGGTWDLFRFPGIRSDSDLHTFGYAFKPWRGGKGDPHRAPVQAQPPHLRLRVQAVAGREGDRRGRVDQGLPRRDGARPRHRPPHPLRPPRRAGGVVQP